MEAQQAAQQSANGTNTLHSKPSSMLRRQGKHRVLLMGLRSSGKSSIISVVFHKLPPSDTLYLESNTKITKESMHTFMDFEVWDFPSQVDYNTVEDIDSIFGAVGAVIFVIDAQDEYFDAIERLISTVIFLQQTYPTVYVEVFVHKVDGLSEDFRLDIFRDIQQHVQDELADRNYETAPVIFHQTSIYDHSIFEAFSKVIQKLIVQLPALESLLSTLCSNSKIEKAYLFDVMSKIYIASDTSPSDITAYETCSDYIDVIVDISEIYGWEQPAEDGKAEFGNQEAESLITMERKGCGYLYLREVHKDLALVCIMGEDTPTDKKVLIDYNVGAFQKALVKVLHDE